MSGPHGTAFSGRVGWGVRPAVLVIDLVRAYTEPGGPFLLPDPAPAVAATAALVDAARAAGVPGRLDGRALRPRPGRRRAVRAQGARHSPRSPRAPTATGARSCSMPAPGEPIVVKQYASGFAGTSLAPTLHALGVDTLVIAGVSTSGCVRATATDALHHGFRPTSCARPAPTGRRTCTRTTSPTSTPSTPTSRTWTPHWTGWERVARGHDTRRRVRRRHDGGLHPPGLDCADVCTATSRVLSRRTAHDAQVMRAVMEACAADAGTEHCRVCAEACRRCERACRALPEAAS